MITHRDLQAEGVHISHSGGHVTAVSFHTPRMCRSKKKNKKKNKFFLNELGNQVI